MVASRYSHPLLTHFGLAGRILIAWSCEYNYFVSCAAHARIAADVPILNLISERDPFFAATESIAAAVAAPGGGYGTAPTGSCAAAMRSDGVVGLAIKMEGGPHPSLTGHINEGYHDTMELTGSLYRHMLRRFVTDPSGLASRGVLSFEGRPLPNTLCDETLADGVLSASCHSMLPYVTPQVYDAFNATKCNWKSELVRPTFGQLAFVPQACVASPATTPPSGSALLLGVVLGASLCAVLGLLLAVYARYALRYRFFVRLVDDGHLTTTDATTSAVPPTTPAASPPYVEIGISGLIPAHKPYSS